jgi:hypothetical protein
VVAAAVFAPVLFGGRVLYFRDVSVSTYPNLVFLEGALRRGVWPLWNPTSDAGAPFLAAYPLDLLLSGLFGARAALHWGAALHLWLALLGGSVLARRLGQGPWGSLTAGLAYGLSGYVLSCANLVQLYQAAAWAPWVLAAGVGVAQAASRRGVVALAVVLALQASTLGGEILLLTIASLPFLLGRLPGRRALGALALAAGLAALLAAPALMGLADLLRDSDRARGLDRASALAFSTSAPVLAEAALPRLFGDVHAFSDEGAWGQAFFPTGAPYLLSLYVGCATLGLALAGARPGLATLAALGVLLSLGESSPTGVLLEPWVRQFRAPVKLLFVTTLAVALMAGRGADGMASRSRVALAFAPAGLLLALAGVLALAPDSPARLLGGALPEVATPTAKGLAAAAWPADFFRSGLLALVAALALVRPRFRFAAPLALGADLLMVNGGLNASAPGDFYALRPEVRPVVERIRAAEPTRLLAYGLAQSRGVAWAPETRRRATDVHLYGLDRQALLARTHVLDGLEAALDEDRTGFAPRDATLPVAERWPSLFPLVRERALRAGVGFVLSFDPLPEASGVEEQLSVSVPGVLTPLRLYALADRLPRAFGLPERAGDPAPRVAWSREDPHSVKLRVAGGAGWVVVLEGFAEGWRARGPRGPVPLLEEPERYWRLPFGGGDEQEIEVRYAPAWRGPALALSAAALAALLGLALTPLQVER